MPLALSTLVYSVYTLIIWILVQLTLNWKLLSALNTFGAALYQDKIVAESRLHRHPDSSVSVPTHSNEKIVWLVSPPQINSLNGLNYSFNSNYKWDRWTSRHFHLLLMYTVKAIFNMEPRHGPHLDYLIVLHLHGQAFPEKNLIENISYIYKLHMSIFLSRFGSSRVRWGGG